MAEQLPQKFGNYTLHKLIARGGMAEIYRATMPGIGGFEKTVAIKKILPHLAEDAEFVTMLKDEANILVSISDSNIAQVYDLGRIGDSYFIAMEYVHGLDLSHVIKGLNKRNMAFPVDHALYIASCICAGLHAAHTNTDKQGRPLNIVHRDVSPHNVIISYAGDVKLIDFGVAKAAVKENHTQVGVIKGKLLYMAPEQAMAKTLDGRADLFAAGLCLYKMLTNELPFRGDNEFQIYNNILSKEIVPPRELNPQVPQEVNQIVMTLLQRDPEKRYQDGYNAKQDLRRALQNMAPGYTVNRLGRFIEDNFSQAAIQRQNAARDASAPSGMPPMTPSSTALGTDQMLAEADLQEIELDTLDVVRVDGPAGPPPFQGAPTPPPTPRADAAAPTHLRTQNSNESTGKFSQQQLDKPPAQSPSSPKIPAAVYLVGALVVVVGVLFGLTFLGDDPAPTPQEPAEAPAPAPVTASAPSSTITVQLDSTPSGAELFRGDDLLGTTPHELTLLRSAEPLELSLHKPGYARRNLELVPDADIDQVFALTALDEDAEEDGTQADAPGTNSARAPSAQDGSKSPTTRVEKDADKPEKPAPVKKPAPKPEPKKAEPQKPASPAEPDDSSLDLWEDEPAKPAPKPAKKPAPKKKEKKEKKTDDTPAKKKDEQPADILNPFG